MIYSIRVLVLSHQVYPHLVVEVVEGVVWHVARAKFESASDIACILDAKHLLHVHCLHLALILQVALSREARGEG